MKTTYYIGSNLKILLIHTVKIWINNITLKPHCQPWEIPIPFDIQLFS